MTMDVHGRAPKHPEGKCFDRTVFAWRDLWEYTCEVGQLGEMLRRSGHYNDGAGLDDVGSIDLASKLEADLADGGLERWREKYSGVKPKGVNLVEDMFCASLGADRIEGEAPRLMREDVQEWIAFLRVCGGFTID